jgi:hypothetical protein
MRRAALVDVAQAGIFECVLGNTESQMRVTSSGLTFSADLRKATS